MIFRGILVFWFSCGLANAVENGPADFIKTKIEARAGLTEDASASQSGKNFYRTRFTAKFGEVFLRVTTIPDVKAGESMAKVESANIRNLYNQRRNPYEGQITEIVKCDPKFGPLTGEMKVLGRSSEITCGGVNQRRGFGACSAREMVRWGCHFAFYLPQAGLAVDVRLYSRDKAPGELRKIREAAGNLFSK